MIIDRRWVERNLGFDPSARPAPASTFAFAKAARTSSVEDIQREIIDFDSEGPEGREFLAFTIATGLSRYTDVPWPKGLAPKTGKAPSGSTGSPLPHADVLVVTWTVDEGHALSRVLTPGKDSPERLSPLHAQLHVDFPEDAPRLPCASGETLGCVLDHQDWREERRYLQI